ncbi:hypothetical protein [Nonomuraea sp. SBT364]|uniref:hypothetical protein n=1 Tax=Nonomuraea sp. SBT364 TaxID=1580530 RepID=UPI00069FE00C|nr:hypothetical protein [Nonomuraea sp. SBT364]
MLFGGLTSASLLFLLGSLLGSWRETLAIPLLAIVTAITVAYECGWRRFELPSAKRLVPQEVIGRGPVIGALQFGFEMGTGARTFMPTFLPYITITLLLTSSSFGEAGLAGLGFGLGRAAMVTARYFYGDPDEWDGELAGILRYLPWAFMIIMVVPAWIILR